MPWGSCRAGHAGRRIVESTASTSPSRPRWPGGRRTSRSWGTPRGAAWPGGTGGRCSGRAPSRHADARRLRLLAFEVFFFGTAMSDDSSRSPSGLYSAGPPGSVTVVPRSRPGSPPAPPTGDRRRRSQSQCPWFRSAPQVGHSPWQSSRTEAPAAGRGSSPPGPAAPGRSSRGPAGSSRPPVGPLEQLLDVEVEPSLGPARGSAGTGPSTGRRPCPCQQPVGDPLQRRVVEHRRGPRSPAPRPRPRPGRAGFRSAAPGDERRAGGRDRRR